jgi:hypothetical protein
VLARPHEEANERKRTPHRYRSPAFAARHRLYRQRHLGPDRDLTRITLRLIAVPNWLDPLAVHYRYSVTGLDEANGDEPAVDVRANTAPPAPTMSSRLRCNCENECGEAICQFILGVHQGIFLAGGLLNRELTRMQRNNRATAMVALHVLQMPMEGHIA